MVCWGQGCPVWEDVREKFNVDGGAMIGVDRCGYVERMHSIEGNRGTLRSLRTLVLTRKVNESIEIDGGIQLKVLRVDGDRVKLGFDAPREVGIKRSELLEPGDSRGSESDNDTGVIGGSLDSGNRATLEAGDGAVD